MPLLLGEGGITKFKEKLYICVKDVLIKWGS